MSILLKSATFINPISGKIKKSHIFISDQPGSSFRFISDHQLNTVKSDTFLNCKDMYVMPSFSCGHHHSYSALSRGMPAPDIPPVSFHDKLKKVWWKLDKALNADMVYFSAKLTAIQCALNGVTFVIDHHSSPSFIKGSLKTIKKAFDEVGIGLLPCYEITDRNGPEKTAEALQETNDYLESYPGLVGLHASFTVGNSTLKQAVEMAGKFNTGIHIHVAEDPVDQKKCMSEHKCRVVERLNNAGVLNLPQSILAHCIHLNEHEKNLIKNSKVWIAQNTESNMNNKAGFFDARGLNDNIILGTDGMHSDMIRAARCSYLAGQATEQLSPSDIWNRFYRTNNYPLNSSFDQIHSDNLVVLDYKSPTALNSENVSAHFAYAFGAEHILYVISNGKLIVSNRSINGLNVDEFYKETAKMSAELWKQISKL